MEYNLWGKSGSHARRIADIKTFMAGRTDWITASIGSYSARSDVSVPSLVITKIMYHPQTIIQFSDENELEFIEIRNDRRTGRIPSWRHSTSAASQ